MNPITFAFIIHLTFYSLVWRQFSVGHSFTLKDRLLVGQTFKTIRDVDWISCIESCNRDQCCFSYNFQRTKSGKGICSLNWLNKAIHEFVFSGGSFYQQLKIQTKCERLNSEERKQTLSATKVPSVIKSHTVSQSIPLSSSIAVSTQISAVFHPTTTTTASPLTTSIAVSEQKSTAFPSPTISATSTASPVTTRSAVSEQKSTAFPSATISATSTASPFTTSIAVSEQKSTTVPSATISATTTASPLTSSIAVSEQRSTALLSTTISPNEGNCSSNPCENNGTCIQNGTSFNCSCAIGFKGLTCDQSVCPPKIDFGIVLDSSGSVDEANFKKVKTFLMELVSYLNVNESGSHIAMLHYDHYAYLDFLFSDNKLWNLTNLRLAIAQVNYTRGATYTQEALKVAAKFFNIQQGCRKDDSSVQKILLVISDGVTSSEKQELEEVSNTLQNKGITIMGIGVGDNISDQMIMAFRLQDVRIMKVSSFDELINEMNDKLKELLGKMCSD